METSSKYFESLSEKKLTKIFSKAEMNERETLFMKLLNDLTKDFQECFQLSGAELRKIFVYHNSCFKNLALCFPIGKSVDEDGIVQFEHFNENLFPSLIVGLCNKEGSQNGDLVCQILKIEYDSEVGLEALEILKKMEGIEE